MFVKRMLQVTLFLACSLLASQTIAQGPGNQATTPGPVWRITYIKVKAGKNADYTKWMREYRTRALAEQKSAGLIVDYKFFSKATSDNTPGDWSQAEAVLYRNYADALDPNSERGAKTQAITVKVFGSTENANKIRSELRDGSTDFVATHLVREFTYNPVRPAGQ
jgi:hypothetical protein